MPGANDDRRVPGPDPTGRRRRLGLFDVMCIGVNAIVGSGVFALPDDMQRAMGGLSPFAYVLCALLLMPVALCFAELAGRHDETGAAYIYARNAFGPAIGFTVGWYCWVATFVSWAANTTLLVELVGLPFPTNKMVVVALTIALGAVNYVGIKPGAWIVNAVVVGKLGAILCFVAVAALAMTPGRLGGTLPHGIAGVGQGIYLALFPLQGFEVAPVAAGETANPRRSVPIATLGSLLFSAVLFVVVQAVLVGSYSELGAVSEHPLLDAARHLGPALGLVVLVGSLVSMGGFTAGSALGAPRYAEAIASNGLLPTALSRRHPRFETPHVAIVVTTAITAALGALFDYRRLVGMSNITIVVQYFFTCLAVPVLRRRDGAGARASGFRVPGGAVLPLLGAVGSITFLAGVDRVEVAFGVVALLVGGVVAVGSRRAASGIT